jgi:hypothetical protein
MVMKIAIAWILWLIVAGTNVAEAQAIGRLFFTPKERVTLDRVRAGQPTDVAELTLAKPRRPAEINGFVKRNSGRDTIWIDGQPHYGTAPLQVSPSAVRTPGGPVVVRSPSRIDAETPANRHR